jgi:hypothetical protein
MYAFRKPFTAANFEAEAKLWDVGYKVWLVVAQAVGYMLSKFIGIGVVGGLKHGNRAVGVLVIIAVAETALLLFAVVPAPWNIVFLFVNGLPLGMVWGIVFSYLEGRRFTDFMGAGLCASFIFASGLVKSVGAWLMQELRTTEFWMPFLTGALFAVPLVLALWVLDHLPPPTPEEEALRTRREPMNAAARSKLVRQLGWGLGLLVVAYMLLSALRDFRDSFMSNLLAELGFGGKPALFTQTEVPIGLGVLVLLAGLMFVRNNFRALLLNHLAMALGWAVAGVSTLLYQGQVLGPVAWLVLVGLGIYLAYVPFNAFLFDRLLATFRYVGTASFLIMVADAFGYSAAVGVLLVKEFGASEVSWVSFFAQAVLGLNVVGLGLTGAAAMYFWRKRAG